MPTTRGSKLGIMAGSGAQKCRRNKKTGGLFCNRSKSGTAYKGFKNSKAKKK